MKYIKITCCVILLYILLIPCGCSETDQVQESDEMLITFDMQHPALARATTSAFEKQDQIGVYMTGHGIPLEVAGNFLNNERLTFDGTKWNPARKLYWDEGSFDVFAYYPYTICPFPWHWTSRLLQLIPAWMATRRVIFFGPRIRTSRQAILRSPCHSSTG